MQPARPTLPRFPAAESPVSARRGGAAAVALGLCVLGAGCFVGDTAVDPPTEEFYYPTGLVRSRGASTLYVTNSDFDLQYNGGTVLALDLNTIRSTRLTPLLNALRQVSDGKQTVAQACGVVGSAPNSNTILNPGPCLAIPLLTATGEPPPSATIGAFASGAVLVQPDDSAAGARLFVPVRGDPSITFLDVNNDLASRAFSPRLSCISGGIASVAGARCSGDHLIGIDPYESSRAVRLPTEPVGIAASEDGTAIVVAHQTENSVSLSIDDPRDGKPTLQFILGSLPAGPTEVATVPIPKLFKDRVEHPTSAADVIDYQRGFLVTYHQAPVLDLFRVRKDESGTSRPYLSRSNETAIGVNADGKDSRGIALDARARQDCESDCAGDKACLAVCVEIPIDVYIANRAPPSLLIGRIDTTTIPDDSTKPTGAFDRVLITNSIPLLYGASKVIVGDVIDADGKLSRRVFVAAFDSRLIFSYDPHEERVDAFFRTGRGPHAMATDTDEQGAIKGARGDADQSGHAFLFVGHFTDSYLGVIDLDMRHPESFGTMFASVGTPMPPKGSQSKP
jgi:DNA-binding beta-propeller fold protein YncE